VDDELTSLASKAVRGKPIQVMPKLFNWPLFLLATATSVWFLVANDLPLWLNWPVALVFGFIVWFLGVAIRLLLNRHGWPAWSVVTAFLIVLGTFAMMLALTGWLEPIVVAIRPYDSLINAASVLALATITLFYAVLTERISEATVSQSRLIDREYRERNTPNLLLAQVKSLANEPFQLINFGQVSIQLIDLNLTNSRNETRTLSPERRLLRPNDHTEVNLFSEVVDFRVLIESARRDGIENQIFNRAQLRVVYVSSGTGQQVITDTFVVTVLTERPPEGEAWRADKVRIDKLGAAEAS
jgi:hypothetical protein